MVYCHSLVCVHFLICFSKVATHTVIQVEQIVAWVHIRMSLQPALRVTYASNSQLWSERCYSAFAVGILFYFYDFRHLHPFLQIFQTTRAGAELPEFHKSIRFFYHFFFFYLFRPTHPVRPAWHYTHMLYYTSRYCLFCFKAIVNIG